MCAELQRFCGARLRSEFHGGTCILCPVVAMGLDPSLERLEQKLTGQEELICKPSWKHRRTSTFTQCGN